MEEGDFDQVLYDFDPYILQTSDGRPVDFHVKKVHRDTLGWRAGVQTDDRIVQVRPKPRQVSTQPAS